MVPYNACVAPCYSTCATRPTAQHYVALQSTQLVSTHRLRGLRQKCGSSQKGDGRSPSLNGNRPSGLTLTLGPELGCEFDQNSHCKLDQSTYQVFDPSAAGLTASSHGDLLSRGTARAETKLLHVPPTWSLSQPVLTLRPEQGDLRGLAFLRVARNARQAVVTATT
ncbi:Uncharacterised protein [Mycobacteroides abscessus subsp. abscessus]|nr:Uncharacterised protein [Mycobacteroides abscessus subsp. abscessus]